MLHRLISFLIIFSVISTPCLLLPASAEISLPIAAQVLVQNGPILKGIKLHPEDPFKFDFIMDTGSINRTPAEATRLIKYFLTSLTVPENELWVNLSPYENNRIVSKAFGQTEMGRDLLEQDYMLKQMTASLMNPGSLTGKKFWARVYEEAIKKFGTTNIPVNTFNKVWILPDKAIVDENAEAGAAYVQEARLKVMMEEDYLAMQEQLPPRPRRGRLTPSLYKRGGNQSNISPLYLKEGINPAYGGTGGSSINLLGSQIVREIIIPELDQEVNESPDFATVRQVYNSLILAAWYKKKIKNSIIAQVYEDKNKVKGTEYQNSIFVGGRLIAPATGSINRIPKNNDIELIYRRYLQAFKKGAYNFIKEDQDPITHQINPRKYFSGGMVMKMDQALIVVNGNQNSGSFDPAQVIRVQFDPVHADPAQLPVTPLEIKNVDLGRLFLLMDLRRVGWTKLRATYPDLPYLKNPETVAEHTWGMCILFLSFAPKSLTKEEIKRGLEMIVVHDIAEIVTGDIDPTDPHYTSQLKRILEEGAVRNLFGKFEGAGYIKGLIDEYNEARSKIAKLVKMTDKLDFYLQTIFNYDQEKGAVPELDAYVKLTIMKADKYRFDDNKFIQDALQNMYILFFLKRDSSRIKALFRVIYQNKMFRPYASKAWASSLIALLSGYNDEDVDNADVLTRILIGPLKRTTTDERSSLGYLNDRIRESIGGISRPVKKRIKAVKRLRNQMVKEKDKRKPDAAQITPGGIDLRKAQDVQINSGNSSKEFIFSSNRLVQYKDIDGLKPNILNIDFVKDVKSFLELK